MPYVTCQRCGEGFYRETGEGWKRLCLSCFIDKKKISDGRDDEIYRLKIRVSHLESENDRLRQRISRNGEIFGRLNLRDLIRLCHPDLHGGSQLATRVTQELNLMREIQ